MTAGSPEERAYLLELYQRTQDDTSSQVSMFDIGAAVGLDKTQAGKMAEDLIGQGWVEVKTLSGGIGITAEGITAARASGAKTSSAAGLQLGTGPVLDENSQKAVERIFENIRMRVPDLKGGYNRIEEVVVDIKTVETQLLSPHPKTAIVREVLRSLQSTLESAGINDLAGDLKKMVQD